MTGTVSFRRTLGGTEKVPLDPRGTADHSQEDDRPSLRRL